MYYPWKDVDPKPKAYDSFKTFSQRMFLLYFNMPHPSRASNFNAGGLFPAERFTLVLFRGLVDKGYFFEVLD